MLGGYGEKILRVNLSDSKISTEKTDALLQKEFLGGRGFGSKILYDEVQAGIDAFDERNKIVLAIGPLTGTEAPSCSRFAVVTKSPLTGGCTQTMSGGYWPAELKKAGYDAIIIEGVASDPTYLWIKDEHVELKGAKKMWGLWTADAERLIKEEIADPRARVVSIGPAGENLVRYACVVADMTAPRPGQAARGGAGAIMGSKKLKAIAIRGSGEVKISDPILLKEAIKEIITAQRERFKGKVSPTGMSRHGTLGGLPVINELGIFPTRNFQTGVFEGTGNIEGEKVDVDHLVKHTACYRCPIACSKLRLARSRAFSGYLTDGPEYESAWAFGPQCANPDPDVLIVADFYCDRLGIDTISTGNAIGFAMELYERGLIDAKETDGLILSWGNGRAIVELVSKIAYRDGFGNILSEGVKRAAESIGRGSEQYAMHSKGLELPAYDGRGAQAHGLGLATSNRGGCHERGFATQELFGIPYWVDRFSIDGKGQLAKHNQDRTATYDSLVTCVFSIFMTGVEPYAKALLAVTGIDEFAKIENLMTIGERVWNIEKAFNVREGFSRKDDTVPDRMTMEPMPDGPCKGHVLHLDTLLDQYYESRGWNKKTSYPTRDKLKSLGLANIANDLERLGRIG